MSLSKKNRNVVNLVATIGIFVVVGCVCPSSPKRTSDESPKSTSTPADLSTSNTNGNANAPKSFDYLKDGLVVVSAKWHKGGFGSIAIWKVTIKNVSDKPLGDIKFSTEYLSETENVVGKGGTRGILGKDTIEKVVPPKSTRTFEVNDGFVSDEAHTASFELESWRIIEK